MPREVRKVDLSTPLTVEISHAWLCRAILVSDFVSEAEVTG